MKSSVLFLTLCAVSMSLHAKVPQVKMAQVSAAPPVSPQEMLGAVNQIRAQSRMCGKKNDACRATTQMECHAGVFSTKTRARHGAKPILQTQKFKRT